MNYNHPEEVSHFDKYTKPAQQAPQFNNYYDKENVGGHTKSPGFQNSRKEFGYVDNTEDDSEAYFDRKTSRDTEYDNAMNNYALNEYSSGQTGQDQSIHNSTQENTYF